MNRWIFFDPEGLNGQPKEGVYRWFLRRDNKELFTIYIGSAGLRKSVRKPSTLARGISEAQVPSTSSDRGKSLDTDFIVGQDHNTGKILPTFRLHKGKGPHWSNSRIDRNDAKRLLYALLKNQLETLSIRKREKL